MGLFLTWMVLLKLRVPQGIRKEGRWQEGSRGAVELPVRERAGVVGGGEQPGQRHWRREQLAEAGMWGTVQIGQ